MLLADWERALDDVAVETDIMMIQVGTCWFTDGSWFRLRDQFDLRLFRRALSERRPFSFRRLMLYDPPSDLGGDEKHYQIASREHQDWVRRVRRQLAACGASGSAGKALPDGQDYLVRLLILDRAGSAPPPIQDGVWFGNPPEAAMSVWQTPGLIPLGPHEVGIIGPYRDRNPLWQGAFLG